jgi:hypothetical protein
MSFVNMMANDVWSSADIDNKVQALIRSRFSAEDELKAARLARLANPTTEEQAFVAAVDGWIADCVREGRQARADMALLLEVFDVEAAERRLAMPVLEPVLNAEGAVTNQADMDADRGVRAAAQTAIDATSADVMHWVDVRRPPPPEPILTEQQEALK